MPNTRPFRELIIQAEKDPVRVERIKTFQAIIDDVLPRGEAEHTKPQSENPCHRREDTDTHL